MSRPIASRIGYSTGQVCNFLHSQLVDAVNNHQFILKDSLGLRIMDSMNLSSAEDYFWHPQMSWPYTHLEYLSKMVWPPYSGLWKCILNIPEHLQSLYLHLARFVLENNYVECKGLDNCTIFLQKIGAAMEISFSVTYANIFMLWLESPVVHDFEQYLLLYKRILDDLFVLWNGPDKSSTVTNIVEWISSTSISMSFSQWSLIARGISFAAGWKRRSIDYSRKTATPKFG